MRTAGNLSDRTFLEHQTENSLSPFFFYSKWLITLEKFTFKKHTPTNVWMSSFLPGERETAFASSRLSESDWVLLLCCLMPTISETLLCWCTESMKRQVWDDVPLPLCTGMQLGCRTLAWNWQNISCIPRTVKNNPGHECCSRAHCVPSLFPCPEGHNKQRSFLNRECCWNIPNKEHFAFKLLVESQKAG